MNHTGPFRDNVQARPWGALLGAVFQRRKPVASALRFNRKRVIIGVHAGGLGDNLAYSALPRLYKLAGARKVLISAQTNYGEPSTRNAEVRDIVWQRNPFVDGFTDEPANVGEQGWPPVEFHKAAKASVSPIDAVAKVHGLSIGSLPPKPDLFYRPAHREDFAGKVVCDPRSISQPFGPELFAEFTHHVARWHGITPEDIIVLDSSHSGAHGHATLPDNPRHAVASVFEYADIIASAKYFLVTESGGQSLAAAVRTSGTFVLMSTRAFNEHHFCWPANKYLVSGQMIPPDQEFPRS